MENLLHSLPDGTSKWRPTSQPAKVDPEDFCPDPEDLSIDSSCDSINEENVFINNISTMALESTIIQRSLCIQRNIRGQKAVNILQHFMRLVLFKARVVQIQLVQEEIWKIKKKSASLKICKFFLRIADKKKKTYEQIIESLKIQKKIAARKIVKNIKNFIKARKNRLEIIKIKIKTRKIIRFIKKLIEKKKSLLLKIKRKAAARRIFKFLMKCWIKRKNTLKRIKETFAARKILKFLRLCVNLKQASLIKIKKNVLARKILKFLKNVYNRKLLALNQIRRKIAARLIIKFLKNLLKVKNYILMNIKLKICARKILKSMKIYMKHRNQKLTELKKKISSRKILKFLQTISNHRKSVLFSLKQKVSGRKILNFLKKLKNRKSTLLKLKQNLFSRKFLKKLRFSITQRKSSLLKIKQNISARKIANLFKSFLAHKKAFSSNLLDKFRDHCAVLIQKHFRGFRVRKEFLALSERRMSRAGALVRGWKTRRVLKNPEILFFKLRARQDASCRSEFIQKVKSLIEGPWVVKAKLPPHRRILYKNSTKQLRISHERKLSSQSLDDSVQKEKEIKKQVKFSLKHHESPKLNEPDLKASAKKSILRSKGNPQMVDWETLQEKLDRVFFEGEGRLSFDEFAVEGAKARTLLFPHRPRIKKKQKRMEMKDWNVDDFELACEKDEEGIRSYQYLTQGKVPVLSDFSRFWKEIDVNSLYTSLKKDYNFLKNGSLV